MKKNRLWKILGFVILGLIVIVFGGIGYIVWFRPHIPVKEIKIDSTADRVARGKYLANHVTVCMDCHSTRDWTKFSGPITPGTEGKGGEKFDQLEGFPGIFIAANITPYKLSGWTDGELYRAITSGVGKGNRPFFPVMPYLYYGALDTEDIYCIMTYIRTLKPISYDPPSSSPDFPMNIILHMIPQPANPAKAPDPSDSLNYGKYLVKAGSCVECHTRADKKGKLVEGMSFAGGREFQLPWGIVRSANITPDKETGIGGYTAQTFINRFKAYDPSLHELATVQYGEFNSIMPWSMYAGMTTSDLSSIYQYLHSLKPISNQVVRFSSLK
ncbi:MAG: cytochrome C [Bacteroidetes bacterium]|nr:cytochrome C [Bacteroidota bacterium]